MMNLLQRSLARGGDAGGANQNPSNTSKPTKSGTGVMGGLHNSGPLSVGPDHSYFKHPHAYDPHFNFSAGYYADHLPSATLPFTNFEAERLISQGPSKCQKKHQHHTHQQHSNSQSQRSSAMSDYNNCANYGKLFTASCLQYLHQNNHIEEIIVAQQLFAGLDWPEHQSITVNYGDHYGRQAKTAYQPNEFEALSKYTYADKADGVVDSYTVPIYRNNQFGSISATHCPLNYERNIFGYQNSSSDYYRISFLETHIYQAQDTNSSPQHLPHHRGNNQQFMHNEWIKANLENLRGYFRPTYNETEILVNVEKKAKYPFVIFGDPGVKFNASNGLADPVLIMPTSTSISLSHELRITDGLFEICDYALSADHWNELGNYDDGAKRNPLGYIISTYQTFPGEDNEDLQKTWWAWTGASYLSRALPASIGLGRLLFFKRRDLHLLKSDCLKQFVNNEDPIFTYVLFCELFSLKEAHLPTTCKIIDQLRARCCGYTALYINCT